MRVEATNGMLLDLASLPHVLTYDASGNLVADSVTDATGTYVQTLTYTGTTLVAISKWVKQ